MNDSPLPAPSSPVADADAEAAPDALAPAAAAQVRLLLVIVALAVLGQMTLNPVIAPLARETGLAEWQVGATISTAAVMVVLMSQMWGRRSQSLGRRPVLVAAYAIAAIAMAIFALVAWLGMRHLIDPTALFILFLVLRGLCFGGAIAAVAPTAQAYIADVTPEGPARVKGMAGVGAVQGIGMIVGAIAGGLLSVLGLIAPIALVPLLFALGLALILLRLRPEGRHTLIREPARVRPSDPRAWPFLLAGFGMFTALGFIQVVTGFLVQDRLVLDANTTGAVTGGSLLTAGIGLALAQAVIVPKSGWAPATLLRVGSLVALIGFLVLIPDLGAIGLFGAMLLTGLGLGIAMPGYTSGASMLMRREEQGSMAGLISATNGLTFVVAPIASTALYAVWPPLPMIISSIVMALVLLFVALHPRFRSAKLEGRSAPDA